MKIYSIDYENRIGVQLEKQYNTENSIQMRPQNNIFFKLKKKTNIRESIITNNRN